MNCSCALALALALALCAVAHGQNVTPRPLLADDPVPFSGLRVFRTAAELAQSPLGRAVPAEHVDWESELLVAVGGRAELLGGRLGADGALVLRWRDDPARPAEGVFAALPRWDVPVRAERYPTVGFSAFALEVRHTGTQRRWELWPSGELRFSEGERSATVLLTAAELGALDAAIGGVQAAPGRTPFGDAVAGLGPKIVVLGAEGYEVQRLPEVELRFTPNDGAPRVLTGLRARASEVPGLPACLWAIEDLRSVVEHRVADARRVAWARVGPGGRTLVLADGRAFRVDRPELLRGYEGRRVRFRGVGLGERVQVEEVLAPQAEFFAGRVEGLLLRTASERLVLEGELADLVRALEGEVVLEGLRFEEPEGPVLRVTGVSATARGPSRALLHGLRLSPDQPLMVRGQRWGRLRVETGDREGFVPRARVRLRGDLDD